MNSSYMMRTLKNFYITRMKFPLLRYLGNSFVLTASQNNPATGVSQNRQVGKYSVQPGQRNESLLRFVLWTRPPLFHAASKSRLGITMMLVLAGQGGISISFLVCQNSALSLFGNPRTWTLSLQKSRVFINNKLIVGIPWMRAVKRITSQNVWPWINLN